MRMWWPHCGQTLRLASRSRWKIICPQPEHLSHRFSGTSVLRTRARILGRTKLVSQLMGKAPFPSRVALYHCRARSLPRAADTGRELTHQRKGFGHGLRRCRTAVIDMGADAADQGRAHHRSVRDLGDLGGLVRSLDAEADGDRQIGVALEARD